MHLVTISDYTGFYVSAWKSYITHEIVECKLYLSRRAYRNAALR